ncbi:prophage protein [Salmonella enterica]|uniref:Prophage protein n=1 Tax=Salmonella enterica TaxID=28901 RepID=A0A379Q3H0_SALER|nr:ead/Ea22-like family protein [Salmonella enterica subsp. salamae serovar Springs]SUF36939.1 prophage protein [Salmonella enterica]HCM1985648.1 ead/Ea22-like family protein [Salmonella enterica subsp. salamae serovar 40:a:z39]
MNIDKQALRKVAEKAQAARARLESFPDEDGVLFEDDDIKSDVSACNKFFVLATPATMLALLDENIQLQREKDAIEAVALALRDDMRQAREQLAAAECRNAELDKRLIEYAGIATREARRVAELEARKVNLSKLSVGEVMHMSGFSRDYAEGWCAGNDNAIHEIRTAGIKVKES